MDTIEHKQVVAFTILGKLRWVVCRSNDPLALHDDSGSWQRRRSDYLNWPKQQVASYGFVKVPTSLKPIVSAKSLVRENVAMVIAKVACEGG